MRVRPLPKPPATADGWNRAHPVGTRVRFERAKGDVIETTTRAKAWSLSTGRAVVPLAGVKGSVAVDKLTVVAPVVTAFALVGGPAWISATGRRIRGRIA